jgi:hypothetical protein
MLIATFGPTTEWVGKTIIRDGDIFLLEDHGPVSARDVMEYDRQGHLVWADVGTRAWVGSLALAAPAAPTAAAQPSEQDRNAVSSVNEVLNRAQHAILSVDDGMSKAFPRQSSDGRTQGQVSASIIGLFLLFIGLGVAVYFLAVFDVSVPVDYPSGTDSLGISFPDRVNNIGLMADRQNGIIIGLVLAVGGGVLMVIGRKRTRPQGTSPAVAAASGGGASVKGSCNGCGGLMDVGVAYCPHCGQKLSWTGVEGPPAAT